MIASGKGGSIINIASMSGHIGTRLTASIGLHWVIDEFETVNYPQPQCAYNACKCVDNSVISLCFVIHRANRLLECSESRCNTPFQIACSRMVRGKSVKHYYWFLHFMQQGSAQGKSGRVAQGGLSTDIAVDSGQHNKPRIHVCGVTAFETSANILRNIRNTVLNEKASNFTCGLA